MDYGVLLAKEISFFIAANVPTLQGALLETNLEANRITPLTGQIVSQSQETTQLVLLKP